MVYRTVTIKFEANYDKYKTVNDYEYIIHLYTGKYIIDRIEFNRNFHNGIYVPHLSENRSKENHLIRNSQIRICTSYGYTCESIPYYSIIQFLSQYLNA